MDQVELAAVVPSPMLALSAPVRQDSQAGISVGDQFVSAPLGPVQAFALNRYSGDVETNRTTPGATAFSDLSMISDWIDKQAQANGLPIIIIQTLPGYPVTGGSSDDFDAALAKIGALPADDAFRGNQMQSPFVAVATPACSPARRFRPAWRRTPATSAARSPGGSS